MKTQRLRHILVLSLLVVGLSACTRTTPSKTQSAEQENAQTTSQKNAAADIQIQRHEDASVPGQARHLTVTFPSAGVKRSMEVFIPAKNDGNRSLLIAFHGYGDTAANFAKGIRAADVANALDVIVAVPQGLKNPDNGMASWNAGLCCAFGDKDRDDVALVDSIPAAIATITDLDQSIIDVAGFSNGGFMVEYLLCQHGDTIRGGLDVAGSLPVPKEQCKPEGKTRLLKVQGVKDTRVPYDGGDMHGTKIPSFNESFAAWRNRIHCSRAPVQEQHGSASCRTQFDCPQGDIAFCSIFGLAHQWPQPAKTGLDVFQEAWQVWTRSSDDAPNDAQTSGANDPETP